MYTQEVLAWAVAENPPPMPFTDKPTAEAQKSAARLMEHGTKRNASWYILLGCDYDGLSLALAQNLHATKNDAHVLIIESNANTARNFLNAHPNMPQNLHIIVDTSPWALFLLTLEHLTVPPINADSSIIHWTMPPGERPQTLNTWRKLFLGTKPIPISQTNANAFKLSVGAIIHPNEAHLDEFFAHIPNWVHEVIVIWDSEYVPDIANNFTCQGKAKHFARPLNNDFSAQRNAMLEHCSGDWLLYLDADERFTPKGWEQLTHMASIAAGGVYFPRITFEGDEHHARMAHGLWPDIQLRFFPLNKGVHFVGSVHEKVEGLKNSPLLAPHLPLVHYSHIYKNAEELRQRLAVFNAAGSIEHKLSKAYPRLPYDFFDIWTKYKPCLLQLPN